MFVRPKQKYFKIFSYDKLFMFATNVIHVFWNLSGFSFFKNTKKKTTKKQQQQKKNTKKKHTKQKPDTIFNTLHAR